MHAIDATQVKTVDNALGCYSLLVDYKELRLTNVDLLGRDILFTPDFSYRRKKGAELSSKTKFQLIRSVRPDLVSQMTG